MRSPGKQISCMIGIYITSDIYRISPGRRRTPSYCLFRVWIELLPDTIVARIEELIFNIQDIVIKCNPT